MVEKGLLARYDDVFQDKPGRTDIVEHCIPTGSAKPIRLPPYRLPHAYRSEVKNEIEDMLRSGIIKPATGEWSAPVVIVKKKDGSLRLCVDFRKLNQESQMDAYPMPRVDDIIDRLGKAKYFSTLDLTKGYWQVPVAAGDRVKIAFSTPFGLYQFTVMPFGLQGAPATFQRLMDRVIRGLEDYTAAYLDDLIIFSETFDEHLHHIQEVLLRLRKAGLTAKKKCFFGADSCIYLGHVVGGGVVCPELSKLDAVESFPVPKTKKDVRAFLGLAGYYRRFIPNFALVAVPLTDLTKKAAPVTVEWSKSCEQSFNELKKSLCSAPVLASPDFDREFVLQTDASDRGIGAVLSQFDEQGQEHPIAYFSKKLLPREERYSTVEKECLAIKLGVQAFKVYLLGRRFKIQTALVWLDRLKEKNARLTRWSLSLQPFDYIVEHRVGRANANADTLSRAAPSGT